MSNVSVICSGTWLTLGSDWHSLPKISETEFLEDFKNTSSAKYLLIVAIESAIDICNHFVARLGGRAPKDYGDCFGILSELAVIPSELVGRLRPMARFRNLLIHLYWEVDNKRVYEIIRGDLSDLETFQTTITKWLRERMDAPRHHPPS